jgi:hypothetical protein
MLSLYNSGGIYIHGRNKNLRPVVICNLHKPFLLQTLFCENNSDIINALVFLIDYIDHFVMIKCKVENFLLIIDCIYIGLFAISVD